MRTLREKGKTVPSEHKKLGPKDIANVLEELRKRLRRLYGIRFSRLLLYGSYARSEAGEDSDIDAMVLLEGKVSPAKEIDNMLDIITDVGLKYNVLVSVYPISEKSFITVKSPLLLNVRREGVSIG